MAERDRDPEPSPWADPSERDEPEPDWVTEIRERRRAHADRLREVFDGFDGKLSRTPPSSAPPPPPDDEEPA